MFFILLRLKDVANEYIMKGVLSPIRQSLFFTDIPLQSIVIDEYPL